MGTKYPAGESPIYPPRDWTCPECGHYHSKPHFALPGQIDESLKPNTPGRVKKDREEKWLSCGKTGEMILNDLVQGLFCPHCGWKEEIVNLIKTKNEFIETKGWKSILRPSCCIQDCPKKSSFTKHKMNFCKEHYELIK